VNPAFTEMTGYKPTDVIGKTPAIFMGKKSIKHEMESLAKALRGKEVQV
jgi:PAS domain S-box-containing protein